VSVDHQGLRTPSCGIPQAWHDGVLPHFGVTSLSLPLSSRTLGEGFKGAGPGTSVGGNHCYDGPGTPSHLEP
jgi:hypothetical protein